MTDLTSPNGTPASRFAFGAMQFGGNASEADARAMYDACRDAGITHFDTAYNYNNGASERILGRLIGADRDSLLIATKAGYDGGAGAANMQAHFDESRRRLGLEMVDVLYLHRFDPATPLEDTIRSFEEICDGKWDHLPEQAFMYVGVVEQAEEQAKQMAANA